MKIKTSELIGAALDWAVAKCEEPSGRDNAEQFLRDHRIGFTTRYSTNWSQGGRIIEREFISVFELPAGLDISEHPTFKPGDLWEAEIWPSGEDSIRYCAPTPLIAAMRCYVASKLGDEIEVPDELI